MSSRLWKQNRIFIGLGILAVGVLALVWMWGRAPPAHEGFQTLATLPSYLAAKCTRRSLNTDATGASINPSTSSASGGATWFCADDTSAQQLIRGDDTIKTAIVPFIAPNDTVCVKQEDDPNKYICKDLAASEDDGDYTDILSENYELSCENYVKGYLDLSNNLTNLVNLRDVIQDQKDILTDKKTVLAGMITQYQCANPPTDAKRIICNAINAAKDNFTGNETTVQGILSQVIAPVQQVLESRTLLGRNANGFRCDIELPCDVMGVCGR